MKGVDFMSIKLHFNIINGPSSSRLIDALEYAYNKENPHQVIFSMKEHDESQPEKDGILEQRKVTVTAIEHEDGSGNSFLFKGHMGILPLPYTGRFSTLYKISGWYNAKTHKGYINAEA